MRQVGIGKAHAVFGRWKILSKLTVRHPDESTM